MRMPCSKGLSRSVPKVFQSYRSNSRKWSIRPELLLVPLGRRAGFLGGETASPAANSSSCVSITPNFSFKYAPQKFDETPTPCRPPDLVRIESISRPLQNRHYDSLRTAFLLMHVLRIPRALSITVTTYPYGLPPHRVTSHLQGPSTESPDP